MPVADTSGNDAIAALLDRCLGEGYRLSNGPETRGHGQRLRPLAAWEVLPLSRGPRTN
jgi:hypothetical protein